MARETRTRGNQTFQDGNLKAAVDGDLVPADFTAVPLSNEDTEWEDYVEAFGPVSLINAAVQAATGGSTGTFTNLTPMPVALGGLAQGSTFDAATMSEMFNGLLYPYQAPAFTSFGISGQTTPLEVGASILTNRTFVWATSNEENVEANQISLVDVTGGSILIASGLANDGIQATSYPASPIYKTSATTHTFQINGINTHAGSFSALYTVTWQWRKYYGTSSNAGPLTEVDVEALTTKPLSTTFAGTYTFGTGGYKYICYPASFGTATTFKDEGTNLDVPFEASYTINIANDYSPPVPLCSYRIHRTTNIIGSAINIIVS